MSELARNTAIVLVLLIVSVATGAWSTMADPTVGEEILTVLKDSIMGEVLDSSSLMMAITLFLNNLQACLLMFLGGGIVRAPDGLYHQHQRAHHRLGARDGPPGAQPHVRGSSDRPARAL